MSELQAFTPNEGNSVWAWTQVKALALDAVSSPATKRAYGTALDQFLNWGRETGVSGLTRATVQQYRTWLEGRGLAPSSINVALSALRKLAEEAGQAHLLDLTTISHISAVKNVPQRGQRLGRWLNSKQATALLQAPDVTTKQGLRDQAILALLLSAGLRRAEVVTITRSHVRCQENRWLLADIRGKGKRLRSVGIPYWTKEAVDRWIAAAPITDDKPLFRSLQRKGVLGPPLSDQSVYLIVKKYSTKLGLPLAPHDTRRTYSALSYQGGASLKQIQISLGHASVQTTERYLNVEQDWAEAPCDFLGFSLKG